MKITQIELFTVPPRWLFVKVSTDEGWQVGVNRLSKDTPRLSKRLSAKWKTS